MNATRLAEMASLFDVNIEDSLEKRETEQPSSLFDDRVEDVKSLMEHETITENEIKLRAEIQDVEGSDEDTDIITKAIRQVDTDNPVNETPTEETELESESFEIPGDVAAEVDSDIAVFASDTESVDAETETMAQAKTTENEVSSQGLVSIKNPLELSNKDLEIYEKIKDEFPRFNLYDGSRAFRDFYRTKFYTLKTLLGRFRVLDSASMQQEISEVNLDHYIDGDFIDPMLVAKKLNSSYKARVRVASLLIDVFEQYPAWKERLKSVKSYLYKDHDMKGIHKREGLALEHTTDMDQYVNELEGFIESAKHIDGMLKAAGDSLSRQLTCLQMKEQHIGKRISGDGPSQQQPVSGGEGLDSISEGTVIKPPISAGVTAPFTFGDAPSDDVADLGG